ncbi:TonB-dependent receptor [Massilibacteroides vaginae]|uniref:TonB-dependent receptor n=1 Tax=Massilibacteroides vaginae TaxID=1673718 RepID=UPI000A1CCD5F|nr:TonB-dependent receptor [Massilibacteroides vaginae]
MKKNKFIFSGKLASALLAVGLLLPPNLSLASPLRSYTMTIQMESATLKTLFELIEEQFDYTFLIRNNDIDLSERVSFDLKTGSVEDILKNALKNQNADFTVSENRIIIYKAKAGKENTTNAANFSTSISQQTQKITGVVVDAVSGEPVIGANIIVKGTSNGTSTDFDGNFSLEVPSGATLVVSYIGYLNLEVPASGTNLTIRLKEDTQALEEVVVVGYTVQKRESLTGALQTLKSEKITTVTSANVDNMLSGKAPGVFVAPGGGRPGEKGNIIIRGKASINGNTDPLWVIDGVIVGNSSADFLNPNDIETMSILKDAASTSIYGSQGANGVVVVTTKRASGDKVRISVSAKLGVNSLDNGNMQVMNGSELYDYFKSFSNQEMISFPRWNDNLRNNNYSWWDLATQTGMAQDYNISISGGSEKVKSYFSLGLYDEEGAIKGYDYKKYSFRYRTEYKASDWLTIKPQIAGSRANVDDRQYSVTAMYVNLPWDSPYLEDGKPTPHKSSTWVNSNKTNYLYDLQWNKAKSETYAFTGNIDFDIRLTSFLTFSSVNNFAWNNYAYQAYTDSRSNDGSGVNGRLREVNNKTERNYTNQLLRFNKAFDKHSVTALVAYEYRDYKFKRVEAIATGFIPGFEVLDATAKPEKTAGYINESAIQSYFFDGNYSYDNKYLAQFSLRRDGASNFGNSKKYGNFFSISGGWNLHREEFLQKDWIDMLKLRVAYGTVGNTPPKLYPQYNLYSVDQSYNGTSGALINQIGNDNFTWEETSTLGVGVDFSFLNRFRVNADLYNKNTSNVLFAVPVSGISGVTEVWQNIGEVQNRGFELAVGADIIKTDDWYWSADFNIGFNTNKIKKLYKNGAGDKAEIISTNFGGPAGSISRILKEGYSSDTFYGREWAGVNPEDGAPQWYTTDNNGNRVLTSDYAKADEVMLGKYSPDYYGGFSTSLAWKQIDLNAVFSYSVGGRIYNYARQEYDSDGTYTDRNQMKLMSGWSRWEKPGDIATHPKASYNNSSNANKVSSRFLEDGDYLKLRSLSIGYNLKLPKFKIENVRLSFTAENLFTITNYSGVDPEIPVRVLDGDSSKEGTASVAGVSKADNYPITRKFMFGINFTL